MKYPMINRQPRREVNVPQLSGGLNLRDSLTGVQDNQMTDCVNMWYKEGMLRTRPGFVTKEQMKIVTNTEYNECIIADAKTHTDIKREGSTLVSALCFEGDDWDYRRNTKILFWWQHNSSIEEVGSITITLESFAWENEDSLLEALKIYSYFVYARDGVAYCYASNGENFYINTLDYASGKNDWVVVEAERYVPTVYTHCQRTGWDDFKGTQFEGYNLIGNSYKMVYSAYNEADSDASHPMRYVLGQELADSGYVSVDITFYDSDKDEAITVTHRINYDDKRGAEIKKGDIEIESPNENTTGGLHLFIRYNYVGFLLDDYDRDNPFVALLRTDALVKKYGCIEDNVVITAQYDMSNNDLKKVFGMTRSVWFGGTANGINDGSRLFLCGNTNDKEKSLVVWSSLNNPLYFPENNYAYVGDKSQAVTAFGQQGENLIIFKEKSTYYSYYNINDNITADDLINQTVVDYEANSVIFPMIQLNANIGCDCPNTVQLCRNRLVWVNSDGNVYTLYSNNQYSERTIYKISDMISSILKKENGLKNAVSCDFEGHYLLAVENRIYAMDYNSYGYQYASSFSKNEDSNVQIPWYIWEIDNTGLVGKIFEMNNRLMLMNSYGTSDGVMLTFSTLSADKNTANDNILIFNQNNELEIIEKKINSKLKTKLFDFSAAGYLKNVDRASIAFGNNGGEPIKVSFLTDKGSESDVVTLAGSSIDERDAAFVTVKNFYVSARAVRTFGVKIECEGPLIIDGLSLQYRMLGGVK